MKKFLLLLLLLSAPACATDTADNQIAGVYKERFKNSIVNGDAMDEYDAENILEIVPEGGNSIYFRTHLEFYNAHVCDMWGIATLEDGKYVYRSDNGEMGQCRFEIQFGENQIQFSDLNGKCGEYTCGARGSYEGITFDRASRRNISYMKVLKASDEYHEALKQYSEGIK